MYSSKNRAWVNWHFILPKASLIGNLIPCGRVGMAWGWGVNISERTCVRRVHQGELLASWTIPAIELSVLLLREGVH